MPSFNQPWRPNLDWNTPAGRVIDRLVEALPADRPWQIILFGSSQLQAGIDANRAKALRKYRHSTRASTIHGSARLISSSESEFTKGNKDREGKRLLDPKITVRMILWTKVQLHSASLASFTSVIQLRFAG
jgi:hypothetical protein